MLPPFTGPRGIQRQAFPDPEQVRRRIAEARAAFEDGCLPCFDGAGIFDVHLRRGDWKERGEGERKRVKMKQKGSDSSLLP